MTNTTTPTINASHAADAMLGSSAAMADVFTLLERVADTDMSVLLIGESGTGKELASQRIHQLSALHDKPYITVNCGAIPSELMESELFGHVKGSFTGAERNHEGYFEQANGGTLFLDEITEMPIELQVKLLRVLETGQVRPIGASDTKQIQFRIIAATNRDPEEAVTQGFLRQDIFYRIAQFPITLPPLRARPEDIPYLAEHFLELLNERYQSNKQFSKLIIPQLQQHDWPGNVRELRHAIERAHVLADHIIFPTDLPAVMQPQTPFEQNDCLHVKLGNTLEAAEDQLIEATLLHCHGNKKEAAQILGISLKTLYNRLNKSKQNDDDQTADAA